ncbi:hypothetical protein K0F43_00200 [Bacteroides fragilis]|nr:hypothetical protein [Bacteroides fragilis]MCE8763126.1 hypothetical protein [Bacteroides fragilis]
MSDDKSQLTISIDIKAEDRKYQIVENSVTSILFKVSDTTTRYVYNIRMGEMRNESETTPEGLKNLNLKKECDLSVKIRTEADQAFVLSEKHRGNIMLVEFFKYEGIPVLCASCVLIVKPSDLKITQVIFKDSTGKEVGCGSVQYEANLKFALRVKYNRPLLRGEKAPKLKCKGYCTNAVTGEYEEISKFRVDENGAYTDTFYCDDGLQESHAGADYVFSFGINNPYGPPFMIEDTNVPVPSIQKIHLIGRNLKKPQITSVIWSSKEMIKFGEDSPRRKSINYNEDGFLHIHARGMYGQKVRVELFEKDSTGIKKLLLGLKDDVTILDNVVCVPVEMSGVYAKAAKGRHALAEGLSFEILAKVTPLDTSIAAFEQDDKSLIELQIYGKADEDKAAKSTVNGTMKFMIADVEEDEKGEEEKAIEEGVCPLCGKKHIDLRSKIDYQTQFDSRFGTKKEQNVACYKACKVILTNAGLSSNSAPNDNTVIQIGVEKSSTDNSSHSSSLTIDFVKASEGLNYINQQLETGYPILVGVDYKAGSPNSDKTTDHFIVIVGRGCKNNEVYYLFYEVGTGQQENGQYKGAHENNKLYLKKDNTLQGTPYHNSNKKYIVVQIRKNILS